MRFLCCILLLATVFLPPVLGSRTNAERGVAGEAAIAATVFFPMHRVERMELDEAAGELPSLAQSFAANAGRSLQEVFCGGPAGRPVRKRRGR